MKKESVIEYLERLIRIIIGKTIFEGKIYLRTSEVRFAHKWISDRLK